MEPLSLDDCRCPVCLEIFMEPVTLPCSHTFCKGCFLESVDKATLCCPLCRKRISSWARLNSRNNTLVDQQLWTQIQTCFPLLCQRRLHGQDAIAEDDPGVCFPRVCQPGELKQEYEDQVSRLTEERRALEEEERRASEEYIQRLLAEEEELLQEERRRRQDDERLARLLSSQLNSGPVPQENSELTPVKKKKKEVSGQMDRFLYPLTSQSSSSDCSFMSNKENILHSQVKLQHPFRRLGHCSQTETSAPHSESPSAPPSDSVEVQLQSRTLLKADRRPSAKRKSSELDLEDKEEVVVTKQSRPSLPPSSSSSSSSSSLEVVGALAEWEVELLNKRQQQEEEDRRLALLLQKELDQEEKQRATDRSRGSSDPYLLRQSSRGREEEGSSATPRVSRKTTKTSSSSSSSPAPSVKIPKTSSSSSPCRGTKQATLTDMFSSLSS